jgi:beta-phosphoglucomutase
MDGVLVHSMPLHTKAWQRYLRNIGIEAPDLEARMHGKRNAELVLDLIDRNLPDDVTFQHGAAKEKLWREMMLETGIEQYRVRGLDSFVERHRSVPKAIGTNAEPANIEFVLQQFGLAKYFTVAVDGYQVERPKPFPDIYLKCAKLLGVHPQNCVVFEDSPTGIEAARAAGMRLVGVETTPTHFEGLDLHIQDFESPELEKWLQTQRVRE